MPSKPTMMQFPSTPCPSIRRQSNPLEDVRAPKRYRQVEHDPDKGLSSPVVNKTSSMMDAFSPPRKHSPGFYDQPSSKRVKSSHRGEYSPLALSTHVGAQELASALALASLASPKNSPGSAPLGTEDMYYQTEDYREDAHTPRSGTKPTPVSPEAETHGARMAMAQRRRLMRPNGSHHHHLPLSPFHPALQMQMQEHSRIPMVWAQVPAFHTGVVPAPAGPPLIPTMMAHPPMAASKPRDWYCDYCNLASFKTFQEAAAHEHVCCARGGTSRDDEEHYSTVNKDSPREEFVHADDETVIANNTRKWYRGCVPLRAGPADDDWLSELNCYLRGRCVEAFSATSDDIRHTSKRGRTAEDQVGLRCVFCKGLHPSNPLAAVSYPTSTAGIYESVKRWQRIHLPVCPDAPNEVHNMVEHLQKDSKWIPTSRQYWIDSAKSLGMVDTNQGIHFERVPGMTPGWKPDPNSYAMKGVESIQTNMPVASPKDTFGPDDSGYITFPDDQEAVPPYVYYLMRQVEPCKFTEADRFVARSKCAVGYPGFQCRHCHGHAGLGKYFPLNQKCLSTNSTSQNIHAHLLKCRKVPQSVKQRMVDLKEAKSYEPRLMAGWRRAYFDCIWERIHG